MLIATNALLMAGASSGHAPWPALVVVALFILIAVVLGARQRRGPR
jgi:hypothetical protein